VVGIATKTWGTNPAIEVIEDNNNRESKLLGLNSTLAKENLNWTNCWSQENAVTSTVNWWKSVSDKKSSYLESCELNLGELLAK
jgi:hypothetical protein